MMRVMSRKGLAVHHLEVHRQGGHQEDNRVDLQRGLQVDHQAALRAGHQFPMMSKKRTFLMYLKRMRSRKTFQMHLKRMTSRKKSLKHLKRNPHHLEAPLHEDHPVEDHPHADPLAEAPRVEVHQRELHLRKVVRMKNRSLMPQWRR
jgi:hypothetical protein